MLLYGIHGKLFYHVYHNEAFNTINTLSLDKQRLCEIIDIMRSTYIEIKYLGRSSEEFHSYLGV